MNGRILLTGALLLNACSSGDSGSSSPDGAPSGIDGAGGSGGSGGTAGSGGAGGNPNIDAGAAGSGVDAGGGSGGVAGRDGGGDVPMSSSGPTKLRTITYHQVNQYSSDFFWSPRISADGQRIVYATVGIASGVHRALSAKFDGTDERELDSSTYLASYGRYGGAVSGDGLTVMYGADIGSIVRNGVKLDCSCGWHLHDRSLRKLFLFGSDGGFDVYDTQTGAKTSISPDKVTAAAPGANPGRGLADVDAQGERVVIALERRDDQYQSELMVGLLSDGTGAHVAVPPSRIAGWRFGRVAISPSGAMIAFTGVYADSQGGGSTPVETIAFDGTNRTDRKMGLDPISPFLQFTADDTRLMVNFTLIDLSGGPSVDIGGAERGFSYVGTWVRAPTSMDDGGRRFVFDFRDSDDRTQVGSAEIDASSSAGAPSVDSFGVKDGVVSAEVSGTGLLSEAFVIKVGIRDVNDGSVQLRDDGRDRDQTAGDGVFTGTGSITGVVRVHVQSKDGDGRLHATSADYAVSTP